MAIHEVQKEISIHTPAKGVTGTGLQVLYGSTDFNPHSRKGSDRYPAR